MEQILINLITGALGGVGAGKSSPTFDLGMIGNIISGLIGGGVLGQVVTLLMPAITAAAQSGDLSISGVISQAIAGGAGGAILTAIIGAIKNKSCCLTAVGLSHVENVHNAIALLSQQLRCRTAPVQLRCPNLCTNTVASISGKVRTANHNRPFSAAVTTHLHCKHFANLRTSTP